MPTKSTNMLIFIWLTESGSQLNAVNSEILLFVLINLLIQSNLP